MAGSNIEKTIPCFQGRKQENNSRWNLNHTGARESQKLLATKVKTMSKNASLAQLETHGIAVPELLSSNQTYANRVE